MKYLVKNSGNLKGDPSCGPTNNVTIEPCKELIAYCPFPNGVKTIPLPKKRKMK